jgi:BolA protein
MMNIQQKIETTLNQALSPSHLEVINESHLHAGHAHGASDSHYKVIIACEAFEGMRQVARHQKIYTLLNELMDNPIHALAIKSYASSEWQS